MYRIYNTFTDFKKTIAFSTGIHVIVFLIFLLIHVGYDFEPAEFAEVSFISASEGSSSEPTPKPEEIMQPARPEQSSSSQASLMKQSQAEPIDLPKRQMLEDEDIEPIQKETGKITPDIKSDKLPVDTGNYEPYRPEENISRPEYDEKAAGSAANMADEGKQRPDASGIGRQSEFQPFTIEGEAAERSILKKVIPQYPEGLQKEAVVKIRFIVLPDGSIGRTIPVQKGDPVLDEITLRAFRQWKFNPLASSAAQRNAEGIITFKYQLE